MPHDCVLTPRAGLRNISAPHQAVYPVCRDEPACLSLEFFSGHPVMSELLRQRAVQLVREAAFRRHGEKQATAIQRAAKLLGISVRTTSGFFYSEADIISDETARKILGRRTDVLLDRLDYETQRHQAETRRILAELDKEAECQTESASASLRLSSSVPFGSVALLGGWSVESDDDLYASGTAP